MSASLSQSIDRDGCRTGFDVALLASLNSQLTITFVAPSGCGNHNDIAELLAASLLSGVAVRILFVYPAGTQEVLLNYPRTSSWYAE